MNFSQNECPVCGSSDFQKEYPVTSNADGPIAGFWIIRCQLCTARLIDPIPPSNILSQHYRKGIYSKSSGRLSWLVDFVFSRLYDYRLREIQKHKFLTANNLLDIGCGKGRFMAHALHRGWKVEGTDTAPVQVSAAQERYNLKISHGEVWEIGFPDNFYTVVTAWHVLEHLEDPNKVVAEIKRILAPGGIFVCEVPYYDSWQARIGRNKWFQLDPPRHLIHYNLPSLNNLLGQHQLEIVHISTFSPELGYFGMLQTVLNILHKEPNWLFQWLKRTKQARGIEIFLAFILFLPTFLLETCATLFRKGGVLRVIAVKK